jgi:asparagine synthase (glutamine-hydrolysing)
MCGIAGIIGSNIRDVEAILRDMADAISHRGPDSSGIWLDDAGGCGLAHRRLAILDLSPAGHQPMASDSGRYELVFNGEIYNHRTIREELTDRAWRGHSDTETLLAGFECWGVESTLRRCVGMFAIALWDKYDRILHLARDRIGEKPLYFGWIGSALVFGSELKALRRYPGFDATVDRNALTMFIRYGYVPAPHSIWRGISKVLPGTFLTISFAKGATAARTAKSTKYWSLTESIESGRTHPFTGNGSDAADALERVLGESVRLQQVSDVPLGAFLSGGVDSSLIASLMQHSSSRPIETFTIGFHESDFDEAVRARAVSRHLGTNHHEYYATPQDALNVIPRLPHLYDEPFADASQIPTWLVCHGARKQVTVALSGDGGDELFGGYTRYRFAQQIWRKVERTPRFARQLVANTIQSVPQKLINAGYNAFRGFVPSSLAVTQPGQKARRFARALTAESSESLYQDIVSHWHDPTSIVIDGQETNYEPTPTIRTALGIEESMMLQDTQTYLPDGILVKLDRAAMGVSLETRAPFLDHRVVEFAWTLPLQFKLNSDTGKQVLRDVLYRYVPASLIERPKQGFSLPLAQWLRGPLREWADTLLNPVLLVKQGYFSPEPITRIWNEHTSQTRDWHIELWDVLMFQAWLQENETI